jgi:hypothetical protein
LALVESEPKEEEVVVSVVEVLILPVISAMFSIGSSKG